MIEYVALTLYSASKPEVAKIEIMLFDTNTSFTCPMEG